MSTGISWNRDGRWLQAMKQVQLLFLCPHIWYYRSLEKWRWKNVATYWHRLNWAFFFSYPISSLLAWAALLPVNRSTSPMHMYTVASPALSQECALSSTYPHYMVLANWGSWSKTLAYRVVPSQFTYYSLLTWSLPTEVITIRDTSISGSPFTVHVLQSPECSCQLRRSWSETLAYEVVPSQFMYYSLLKCRLQLRIMIKDTSISGGPFTVHVLQSPDMVLANWGDHNQRHQHIR